MTDAEIIKALEICADDEKSCDGCVFHRDNFCGTDLEKAALDLIKRQQEYIEELEVLTGLQRKREHYNRFVKEVWQKEKGELHYPDFDEIYKRYFEQQERIEVLKKKVDEYPIKVIVGHNSEVHSKTFEDYEDFISGVATEGIKEFADRIVEELTQDEKRWRESGTEFNDATELGIAQGLRLAIKTLKGGGVDG